jgi:hypothetical protein
LIKVYKICWTEKSPGNFSGAFLQEKINILMPKQPQLINIFKGILMALKNGFV